MRLASLRSHRFAPVLLAVIAAILWGLWWMPIRALEDAGMVGAWANISMNLGALPVLAAAALARPKGARISPRSMLGAAFMGVAVTLFGSSLAFTDVVRVVLLFYLLPAWSTAIECLFMGRRWSLGSLVALSLSLAGILTIYRGEIVLTDWNQGDVMALASGLAWSIGATLVFTASSPDPGRLAFATMIGSLIAAGVLVAVMGDAVGPTPTADAMLAVIPFALALGSLYLALVLLVTLWSAIRLPPATMSFLLTAEIVSGIGSSTLVLGERFGWVRGLGATLIAMGALVEVVGPFSRRHR